MKRAAAVLLLLAGAAPAQVTRTETQSVLVDVLVTDKKGNYVGGLTERDFQVWEDGKEQTIDGLFTEKGSAVSHSVILLFDNAAMTAREQAAARLIASQLLDRYAASQPNFAVLDFSGALRVSQTFTTDVTRAKRAIQEPKGGALGADQTIGITNDFAVRDLLRSLDGLVKNLQAQPGRKSLVWFTPGYLMSNDYTARLNEVTGAANRSNVSFYPVNVRTAANFTDAEQDIPAPTMGRGGRGAMPSSITLRGSPTGMAAANAPGNALPSGPQLLSILLKLADSTGGFVVRQAEDQEALARMAREQGEFYVLSYSPPESPDGSCHKLRVRVKRDGVNVRSREGYCKRTPGALLSGNPVERTLEAKALATADGNVRARIQAPHFYKSPRVARVVAAMELDTAGVVFKKERNKFTGQLSVLGIATATDGAPGARFSDVVKFEFDTQAQVDQFHRTPYRYENQFDIAPGDYTLAVALGAGGDNFARLEAPLAIDPFPESGFHLSAIALSREYHPADTALAGLDEFLIDDRKKLVADGMEVIPAGARVLRSTGTAAMFIEIHDSLLAKPDPDNPLVMAFQLRILENSGAVKADTGAMRLDVSAHQGQSTIPVGLNLPLESLTPGSYTLEFEALDSAGRSAKRTALFEIE